MSMYTTVKTWNEMIKELQALEPPYCLSVNYDPDNDEYKMWCGSQPYYFYDNEIEKLDDKVRKLEEEVKQLRQEKEELEKVEDIFEVVDTFEDIVVTAKDKEFGTDKVRIKWDGCIDYHVIHPTTEQTEQYIHICDVDDAIEKLKNIRKIGKEMLGHHGEW